MIQVSKITEDSPKDYVINNVDNNLLTMTKPDGTVYNIERKNNNWTCTCPSFKYRGTCKHLDYLYANNYIKKAKERQPIEKMEPMKQAITPIFDKYDSDWEIVGSYRRGKDTFKDVDILVHCSESDFNRLADELSQLPDFHADVVGDKIIRGLYKVDDLDIELDINRVYTDAPAAMMLYRTGPADLNTFMRRKAMSKGWSLSEKGLLDHITGSKVSVPQDTEEDIFKALDIPYLTPQQRENWSTELDVSSLESEIKRDMHDNVYSGSRSIVNKLADLITADKDNIMDRIEKSKAKDKIDAIVYYVKPLAKTLAAYPYSGECIAAYQKATGIRY